MAVTGTEGQRVPPQTEQGKTSRRKRAAEGEDIYCQRPACKRFREIKPGGAYRFVLGQKAEEDEA